MRLDFGKPSLSRKLRGSGPRFPGKAGEVSLGAGIGGSIRKIESHPLAFELLAPKKEMLLPILLLKP